MPTDSHCTISDLVLLFSVIYFTSDIGPRWKTYQACRRPLPLWIVVSFVSVALSRLAYFVGQWITSSSRAYGYDDEMGELLLLSDPRTPPKWLSIISLGILFPFFVSWTIIGSFWFAEVVDDQTINYCFSDKGQIWLYLFWLVVCYFWAALYSVYIVIIVLMESDDRLLNGDRRYSADPSSLWPDAGLFVGHGCPFFSRGLPISKIQRLPYFTIRTEEEAKKLTYERGHCAICLETFCKNDDVRKLTPCKHVFHRGCIDLWMVRSGWCPNCKGAVGSPMTLSRCSSKSSFFIMSRLSSKSSLSDATDTEPDDPWAASYLLPASTSTSHVAICSNLSNPETPTANDA